MTVTRERETVQEIFAAYRNFIEYLGYSRNSIRINKVTLLDISTRYHKDIDKLYHFHDVEYPDCHKMAGYMTYWISKLKPITVIDTKLYSNQAKSDFFKNVNEHFALCLSMGIIRKYSQINKPKKIKPSKNFLDSFIFLLRYRITTGSNLCIMYYYMETDSVFRAMQLTSPE